MIMEKNIAIISYVTLIGWLVALVMHGTNKTSLGAYHLRQALGVMVFGVATMFIRATLIFIPLGWLVGSLFGIFVFVLWVLGLISAINGEEKPLPIFGNYFQTWFASIGN
jgi:uncharacterized membrane protein